MAFLFYSSIFRLIRQYRHTVLVALALSAYTTPLAAQEIVPSGAWVSWASANQRTYSGATTWQSQPMTLAQWVLQNTAAAGLSGDITQSVQDVALGVRYGWSDDLNLELVVSTRTVDQSSTLSGAVSPTETAWQNALQTATYQGLGEWKLGAAHRLSFDDNSAFFYSVGIVGPGSGPQTEWIGHLTPTLGFAGGGVYGTLNWEWYPRTMNARWALTIDFKDPLEHPITLPGGTTASLNPGTRLSGRFEWHHELSFMAYGVSAERHDWGENMVDGTENGDFTLMGVAQVYAEWGNMAGLEQAHADPLGETKAPGLPWRLQVSAAQVLGGLDIPHWQAFNTRLWLYF